MTLFHVLENPMNSPREGCCSSTELVAHACYEIFEERELL